MAAAALLVATAACSSDDNASPTTTPDAGTSTLADATATTDGTAVTEASSTAETSTTADAGALSFATDIYAPIISTSCAGCHGPLADGGSGTGLAFGHLDMSTEALAWADLVGDGGVLAQGAQCGPLGVDAGLKRVDIGSAAASLIYNKVASNAGDGGDLSLADGGPAVFCGNPMPLHFPAIPAAEITAIQTWINEGANP